MSKDTLLQDTLDRMRKRAEDRRWNEVCGQLDEMQRRAMAEREAAERATVKQMDLFT